MFLPIKGIKRYFSSLEDLQDSTSLSVHTSTLVTRGLASSCAVAPPIIIIHLLIPNVGKMLLILGYLIITTHFMCISFSYNDYLYQVDSSSSRLFVNIYG